jgi:pilus assembly protein FimV
VLKQHLDAHQDMSPLGFLDLLGIYHQLGRKDDYDALRTRFERRFSAHIPNFAAFTDEGLGLEDYPATMLVIQSAWGDVRVLDTIEAHLMRLANDTGRPLDLAAYRDLLMLYGVAQDVFVPAGTTRPATGWTPFSGAAPLGAAAAVAPPMRNPVAAPEVAPMAAPDLALDLVPDSLPSALEPMGGPAGLDLDIDLSTVPAPVQPALPRSQGIVDIDLPLLDDVVLPTGSGASPVLAERAPAAPEPDSGLIDFDLFDPNTEARIAPKSNR